MQHVSRFDPNTGINANMPSTNPILLKALSGDNADNIIGYNGIGPIKGSALATHTDLLLEFINNKQADILYHNMKLIDLSLNPETYNNIIYILDQIKDFNSFDKPKIYSLAKSLRVHNLITNYHDLVLPFKVINEAAAKNKKEKL